MRRGQKGAAPADSYRLRAPSREISRWYTANERFGR